jgi:F-type H+-transporting ATPase subunit c
MKWIKSIVLAAGFLLLSGSAAWAQATPAGGAAMGIGGLAKGAVESMARQPEIAGNIQAAMVLAAALIEGATFFALLIIILMVFFK